MNDTTDSTTGAGTGTETPTGPRLSREQVRDLDRLRRSTTDRYIAGVAGGLGRHFGIDPTVIRVLLAVLTLFGGAGLLVYGAVWLLVPEDGQERAPWHLAPDTRRTLLVGTGLLALVLLVAHAWGWLVWGSGWGPGWALGLLAIVAAVVLAASQGRRHPGGTPTPASAGEAHPIETLPTDHPAADHPAGDEDLTPPSWTPPQRTGYTPPRRPRRTGLLLFWPALAAIALAEGLLGIFDIDHPVTGGAWAAVALGIVGVALVVGAFVGRPGGLILLGLPLIPLLIATSVLDGAHWQSRRVWYSPDSAAQVASSYRIDNGRLDLDLRNVTDVAALDGRTIDVELGAGEITVEVPSGTRVDVDARITYAGDVQVGDREQSGFGNRVETVIDNAHGAANAPLLHLDIRARVGHILVQGS